MKAIVNVDLKTGVLDPQGKAICETLSRLGFNEVSDARIGKRIELDLADDSSKEAAETRVKEMCETLLANTVIERYSIELIEG